MVKKIFAVICFFLFLSVLFFRPYFLNKQIPFPSNLLVSYYQPWASYAWEGYPAGAVPNKPMGFDNLRIFYPLRALSTELIKHRELPLWNPYNFAGNTLLATYQSAIFHPLSILFYLLPQVDAWSVMIMLTPVLAGTIMFLFLHEMELDDRSCLLGAVCFAFSSYMIVWWEESFMSAYGAVFLPLILLSVEKIIKRADARGYLGLTIALAWSILSGWFQMTFYSILLAFTWFIFRLARTSDKLKKCIVATGAITTAILVSAIHLIPGFEAMQLSARGTTDAKFLFDDYLMGIHHLITLIAPDFWGNPGVYNYFDHGFYHERMLYVGVVPFLFVLYLLFSWKKLKSAERFFLITFFVTMSLGFSLPTSWFFLYTLKLPFLSVIIPSRIFFLTMTSASILAGFGLMRLRDGLELKPLRAVTSFITTALLGLWSTVLYIHFFLVKNDIGRISLRNLILPTGLYIGVITILWIRQRFTKTYEFVTIGLLVLTIAASLQYAGKYLYFSDRPLVFPETPVLTQLQKIAGVNRFWSPQQGHMESNFATQYRLFSGEGYDSIYIRRYGELVASASNDGKYVSEIPRTDATIPQTDTFSDILVNPYRTRLLQLLGVKYLMRANIDERHGPIDPDSDPRFVPRWSDDKFTIFEYMDSLPRTFVATNYTVEETGQKILDQIFNPSINLRNTVILEEKPDIAASSAARPITEATITSYTPNHVTVTAKTNVPGFVFLSDNYFPGWVASVDGIPAKIYRADYAFRAVPIAAGTHTVRFSYEPASFYWGAIISVIGLIVAGVGVIYTAKRS